MHQRFTSAIAILLLSSVGLACSVLRPKSPLTWHAMLEIDAGVPDREAKVRRTVSVIEHRLDSFRVYNAKVTAQGKGRILVSLPDVPDRKRLIELITAQGLLELVAVITPPSPTPVQTFNTEEQALASLGATVPGNRRVLPYSDGDESTSEQSSEVTPQARQWIVVEVPAIVGGGELRDARAISYGDENYHISFSLTPAGAQKFGDWTGAHINDYLGIVLNGEVKSIAYIKSQITDQGEISGRFSKHSAEDLALVLRSGALPAPVKVIETGDNK